MQYIHERKGRGVVCRLLQVNVYSYSAYLTLRPKGFWLIWHKYQSSSLSVYSPPSHMVGHENCIWSKYVQMSIVYAYQIVCDSDLQFLNGSHFGICTSLICYPAHIDSHGEFILHKLT